MFLYSCPHSTSEGRQVRGWIRVIWRLWGWWWRRVWESRPIWISSANQGMWWYRMLSVWCTIFSWSIQCLCLKLLQFFGASLLLRGRLHDTGVTEAPVEVHSSSLSWLSICLHDTITKCHAGMSHSGVSSPWLLYWSKNYTLVQNFTMVSCKCKMTTCFSVKSVCWWTGMGSSCNNVCDFELHMCVINMKCTFK